MIKTQVMSFTFFYLFSVLAQANQWIVGGSLGVAWGEADSSSLNKQLTDRGINATVSSIDSNRIASQVFVGYEYLPRWGVEVGYVDLGDIEAAINGTLSGINNYFTTGQDIYPQSATGWQVSSIYRYPVGGKLQWSGRLGIYSWTTDYTLQALNNSQKVSDDGMDVIYGLGLEIGEWIKSGGIIGQVNWDRYSINGESIDVLGFGVSYRF